MTLRHGKMLNFINRNRTFKLKLIDTVFTPTGLAEIQTSDNTTGETLGKQALSNYLWECKLILISVEVL